jgi:chromosome segregation ATPase
MSTNWLTLNLVDQVEESQINIKDLEKTRDEQDKREKEKSEMLSSITGNLEEMTNSYKTLTGNLQEMTNSYKTLTDENSNLKKELQRKQSLDNIKTQMVNNFANETRGQTMKIKALGKKNDEFLETIQTLETKHEEQQSEEQIKARLHQSSISTMSTQLTESSAGISALQIELEEISGKFEATTAESNQRQESMLLCQRELDSARGEIHILTLQVKDICTKNGSLETTNHEQQLESQTKRTSMVIVSTQLAASSARNYALKLELQEIKEQFEYATVEHHQELDNCRSLNWSLSTQVQELQAKAKDLENTNQQLMDDLTQELARCSALDLELRGVKEKCELSAVDAYLREAQFKANELELEMTKAEVEKLHTKINSIVSSNQQLTDNLTESEKNYSVLKTKLEETESKYKHAATMADERQQSSTSSQWELEEVRSLNENLNAQIQEMQTKISSLESSNQYLSNDSVESSGRCSALKTELTEIKEKLGALEDLHSVNQSLNAQVQELEMKVDTLEYTNQSLNGNLESLNARYSALVFDMDDVKDKFKTAIVEAKEWSSKLADINKNQKGDLKDAHSRIKKLTLQGEERQKKIEELESAKKQMANWLKTLYSQVKELEETKASLASTTKSLEEMSEANGILVERMSELESEVHSRKEESKQLMVELEETTALFTSVTKSFEERSEANGTLVERISELESEVAVQKEENKQVRERQSTILSDISMHTAALRTVQLRWSEKNPGEASPKISQSIMPQKAKTPAGSDRCAMAVAKP